MGEETIWESVFVNQKYRKNKFFWVGLSNQVREMPPVCDVDNFYNYNNFEWIDTTSSLSLE